MFRRKSETAEPAVTLEPKPTGKNRPTPTRKEAEAAAKARAKGTASSGRAASGATRAARAANAAKMREAMKNGDERYLPQRDKGPVRRFVRDYVDTKITLSEWALPLVVISLLLGFVASADVAQIINNVLLILIVVIVVNLVILRFMLFREVARRFPDASTRGLTTYMAARALQMRWIRMPRAMRRVGEQLPNTYR